MIIRVTNANEFPIFDRYDGIPYTFPVGESVKVPIEAAAHFFGFPVAVNEETGESKLVPIADFRHVARRYGWDTPPASRNKDERPDMAGQFDVAQRYFNNLKIEVRREVVSDVPVDENTLPAPRRGADTGFADAVADVEEAPPAPRRKYHKKTRGGAASERRRQILANARAAKAAKRDGQLDLATLPETAGDLGASPSGTASDA